MRQLLLYWEMAEKMNKKIWKMVTGAVMAAVIFSFGLVIGYRQGTNSSIVRENLVQKQADMQPDNEVKIAKTEENASELYSEPGKENISEEEQQSESAVESVRETVAEETETDTEEVETETEAAAEDNGEDTTGEPISGIASSFLEDRQLYGEKWGISIENLSTGEIYNYGANTQIQSASVIKVFIMGAVYEHIIYPENESDRIYYNESYEGQLRDLISGMITVSDNDCANRLVEILGEGSYTLGFDVVNDFCSRHGYDQTHMGRRFLESNPVDDNYVSAKDCRSILSAIYHRKLVSESACEEMENYLKGQTRKNKIPSGLPDGFYCANKTGEMYIEYGLGSIENDMAIVYSPYGDYIIVTLAGELGGRNSEAISLIGRISAYTANWFESLQSIQRNNTWERAETEIQGLMPEA